MARVRHSADTLYPRHWLTRPILEEYLNTPDIVFLKSHDPISFNGIELMGFYDIGLMPNNEDDVMVLVITNEKERVLIEADARLSIDIPNFRQFISMIMRRPDLETAVFLTTENELFGTLESRNCINTSDRLHLQELAIDEMLASIAHLYQPVDNPDDIWQGDRMRLIHDGV